jgi:hypothetical protein
MLCPSRIGALLRIPWETVQQHMLERLRERGFDDFDRRTSPCSATQDRSARDRPRRRGSVGDEEAGAQLPAPRVRAPYLECEPHLSDLRSKGIVLTQRGVPAVGVSPDAVTAREVAWEQRLGPDPFRPIPHPAARTPVAELARTAKSPTALIG